MIEKIGKGIEIHRVADGRTVGNHLGLDTHILYVYCVPSFVARNAGPWQD